MLKPGRRFASPVGEFEIRTLLTPCAAGTARVSMGFAPDRGNSNPDRLGPEISQFDGQSHMSGEMRIENVNLGNLRTALGRIPTIGRCCYWQSTEDDDHGRPSGARDVVDAGDGLHRV